MRKCGECSLCCTIGYVPEIQKPAHTPCSFIKTSACGSCSIFNQEKLPETCRNYRCSWLNGYGEEQHRPDKINVLFTDNLLENQRYFTAIENESDAIFSDGAKSIWLDISNQTKVPIIVVKYGMKPPHDTGDYVIIHDDTLPRCRRIAGEIIFKYEEIGIYQLIKGG